MRTRGSTRASDTVTDGAGVAPDEPDLEEAHHLLDGLRERAKSEPSYPFQERTLGALALIKAEDPETWANARADLKAAGVSLKDLMSVMERRFGRAHLRVLRSNEPQGEAPGRSTP